MENVDPSEAEAVSYTRKLLTDNMKLYQSAKLLGITVSDEELEKQIQDYITDIPQADNFNKEYKKIYEEAGISLEESAEKNKEFMRFGTMRHMLYRHIRDEFADGKDTVDGHVYENTEDYYYAYLEHIAYPQIEESVIKDFTEQLDQAEKLYYEKYGKSS